MPLSKSEIVRFYRARAAVQEAKMTDGIRMTEAIGYQDRRDEYNRHADMWEQMDELEFDRLRRDIIDVEQSVARQQQ